MPIPQLVVTTRQTQRPARRLDPVLLLAAVVALALASWAAAPLATAQLGPVSSDTRIELEVPIVTSVTPGWEVGETSIRLPNLSVPGEAQDVTSAGWKLSTNWVNGYEVRIRATTDPALRGSNAVDGQGARSSFLDYSTRGCPCPWSDAGHARGIFGYSASVTSANGPAAVGSEKWGTRSDRRWRGFTRGSYPVYATPGGRGEYTMAIHLRTMIPDGAVQPEGSYRAGVVVSAHPLM